eukprot:c7027_g1_i2.p1 GENE.c7027_g1_i2~~c7027_g1_i2.p1  ORF type:complete len:123 (-),score=23.41 c7027_g1_i2:99-467(-)
MNKKRDMLYILTVVELVDSNTLSQFEDYVHMQIQFNEELERHSEKLVTSFVPKCTEAGVEHFQPQVLRGREAKYEIETWANTLGIDNVVLARRGLSESDKTTSGSVSDYCATHLLTNVVIVK